ncbi:MAG: MBL fold metallo-hydrolase RNA specificity domain-containing protein, partial [Planctomycetota bacterium]
RRADWVVLVTTFGRPASRLPPRGVVIERLLETVHDAFAAGRTPVVHAYALGKSQEVTKVLTSHGVPVLQHPAVWRISQVYERCGVALSTGDADVAEYSPAASGRPLAGHAVVTLPRSMKNHRLAGLGPVTSIAVTGWANAPGAKHRLGVDVALPLSDHADFDELIEMARRVEPERIFVTHGPGDLTEHLRTAGFDAAPLERQPQGRLF